MVLRKLEYIPLEKKEFYQTAGIFETIAKRRIALKFGKFETCATDGKTVLITNYWANIKLKGLTFVSYVAFQHELAHILFNSDIGAFKRFQMDHGLPELAAFSFNILEDERVESLWNKIYTTPFREFHLVMNNSVMQHKLKNNEVTARDICFDVRCGIKRSTDSNYLTIWKDLEAIFVKVRDNAFFSSTERAAQELYEYLLRTLNIPTKAKWDMPNPDDVDEINDRTEEAEKELVRQSGGDPDKQKPDDKMEQTPVNMEKLMEELGLDPEDLDEDDSELDDSQDGDEEGEGQGGKGSEDESEDGEDDSTGSGDGDTEESEDGEEQEGKGSSGDSGEEFEDMNQHLDDSDEGDEGQGSGSDGEDGTDSDGELDSLDTDGEGEDETDEHSDEDSDNSADGAGGADGLPEFDNRDIDDIEQDEEVQEEVDRQMDELEEILGEEPFKHADVVSQIDEFPDSPEEEDELTEQMFDKFRDKRPAFKPQKELTPEQECKNRIQIVDFPQFSQPLPIRKISTSMPFKLVRRKWHAHEGPLLNVERYIQKKLTGDRRIPIWKKKRKELGINVTFVLDYSGSMSNDKIILLAEAMWSMWTALEKIPGADVDVLGYSSGSPTPIKVFKKKEDLQWAAPHAATGSHAALEYAFHRIKRKMGQQLIIHITDGAPDDSSRTREVMHLINEKKIPVFTLLIGSNYSAQDVYGDVEGSYMEVTHKTLPKVLKQKLFPYIAQHLKRMRF